MVISQTAEYALRAMVYLAGEQRNQGSDEPVSQTVQQIAEGTQVPMNYLSKVLQQLTRAGLIASQRGLGGGFRLVLPPEVMTVYDVVNTVDPVQRITNCPLHLRAHRDQLCPMHQRLDDAMALIEAQFRATTIAELLAQPGTLIPLQEDNTRPKTLIRV
jgi:Rrf2 family nitric oxide-sensitive transcriptional repressor